MQRSSVHDASKFTASDIARIADTLTDLVADALGLGLPSVAGVSVTVGLNDVSIVRSRSLVSPAVTGRRLQARNCSKTVVDTINACTQDAASSVSSPLVIRLGALVRVELGACGGLVLSSPISNDRPELVAVLTPISLLPYETMLQALVEEALFSTQSSNQAAEFCVPVSSSQSLGSPSSLQGSEQVAATLISQASTGGSVVSSESRNVLVPLLASLLAAAVVLPLAVILYRRGRTNKRKTLKRMLAAPPLGVQEEGAPELNQYASLRAVYNPLPIARTLRSSQGDGSDSQGMSVIVNPLQASQQATSGKVGRPALA